MYSSQKKYRGEKKKFGKRKGDMQYPLFSFFMSSTYGMCNVLFFYNEYEEEARMSVLGRLSFGLP